MLNKSNGHFVIFFLIILMASLYILSPLLRFNTVIDMYLHLGFKILKNSFRKKWSLNLVAAYPGQGDMLEKKTGVKC